MLPNFFWQFPPICAFVLSIFDTAFTSDIFYSVSALFANIYIGRFRQLFYADLIFFAISFLKDYLSPPYPSFHRKLFWLFLRFLTPSDNRCIFRQIPETLLKQEEILFQSRLVSILPLEEPQDIHV